MKNILLWLFCIILCYQLTAEQQIHNSIYNSPSSSNAIYNGYNLFTENDNFTEHFNGQDDDLDVDDDIDDYEDASDHLSDNPRHNSLLQNAVLDNDLTAAQDILHDKKIDVNYQNKDGRTALHFAAGQDNNALTLILLDHGANVALHDYQGWTPLHAAVDSNAFSVVKTLLDNKADLLAENFEGKKSVDYAKNDIMRSILKGQ